jgi:hypothetical protein
MNQSADSLKVNLRAIQGYVPDLSGMLVFESQGAAQQTKNESVVVRLSPYCRSNINLRLQSLLSASFERASLDVLLPDDFAR